MGSIAPVKGFSRLRRAHLSEPPPPWSTAFVDGRLGVDIPGMRFRIASLVACATLACGQGAVTDPLGDEFGADPRPVLGEWQVSLPTPPGRFDALVERDAGTLSGYFEFELWGRWWVVRFADATWDGEFLRFVEPTDFGQREADSLVYWEARYLPARSGMTPQPARVTLSASFGPDRSCCIVTMTYFRPAVPAPATGERAARRTG
jgi:hypothetical protein